MMKEKTIAEITVSADYKTFRQYFIYSSLRRALPWFNWMLMFAAAPAFELFLAVRILTGKQPFSALLLLLLGINLLGAAYLLLEPRILYRRRAKEWERAPSTYVFEEERILLTDETEHDEKESIAYDALQLVSETRTAFYLHAKDARTGENTCIALPKSSMGRAQALALRELFAEELGERFKGAKK